MNLMTEPRARIGYTLVAYLTEIFLKLFYELVPEGVLLQILTQHVSSHADGNMKIFHKGARATVETFMRAGSDMVILGGSPTNLARGENALEETLNDLSVELGILVSSSATA